MKDYVPDKLISTPSMAMWQRFWKWDIIGKDSERRLVKLLNKQSKEFLCLPFHYEYCHNGWHFNSFLGPWSSWGWKPMQSKVKRNNGGGWVSEDIGATTPSFACLPWTSCSRKGNKPLTNVSFIVKSLLLRALGTFLFIWTRWIKA
jgi:hypothetical protein